MKRFVVIGMGQIGMRHAQSLADFGEACQVVMVDTNPARLEECESFLKECFESNDLVSALYITSLGKLKGQWFDIAIIATTSNVRLAVLNNVLSQCGVSYLILEKFLFSSVGEYEQANALLQRHNVPAFVNCPFRAMPSYVNLKQQLTDMDNLQMMVSGAGWGMLCNMIHYVDLYSYLTGKKKFQISSCFVSEELCASKRLGYCEVFGELSLKTANGFLRLVCDKGDFNGVCIKIRSNDSTFLIDEAKGNICFSNKNGHQSKCEEFPILYQSQLTKQIVVDLLQKGSCQLSPYVDSARLHLQLLEHLHGVFESDQVCIT